MGSASAVRAYRDSIYDGAILEAETRSGAKSSIFGGIGSGIGLLFNGLWRPFKVGGAFVFGYSDAPRDFPAMPAVPGAFKGTDLGKAFEQSWQLKKESTNARVEGFAKLMNLDINDWWASNSVARHAEAKDRMSVFAEEGEAMQRGAGGAAGFAAGILAGRMGGSPER